MIPATTDSIKKKYTICGIRCPNVTIKNMKCTKKKKVGRFLFRKKKKKKKQPREEINEDTTLYKGDAQKISCPAEIYELQPLPVCVLCCLMAAVVSD